MSEIQKTEVRELFASIAKKYDLMNDLITFGLHRIWKRRLIAMVNQYSANNLNIIDVASGTGDIALSLIKDLPERRVTATDFCEEMLDVLKERSSRRNINLSIQTADAMALDFADNSFDSATIGYGIRNVPDPLVCLKEMARVVASGGVVAILETGQPKGLFNILWKLHTKLLIPFLGWLLASNIEAYTYLPSTAASFPSGDDFLKIMDNSSVFSSIKAYPQLFGVSYIYVGIVK
jgi:demethylmenaquinone methyltransferase/2-methoxy-6-polyprenyl-1,4-benzoquinol methylase